MLESLMRLAPDKIRALIKNSYLIRKNLFIAGFLLPCKKRVKELRTDDIMAGTSIAISRRAA